VVLPLPRKPVSNVVDIVSGSGILINHAEADNPCVNRFTGGPPRQAAAGRLTLLLRSGCIL
jgi:hypothetical protein